MTKKIETKPSGKVVGIRGLYKDANSGRLYVRVNAFGTDRQQTITGNPKTFTELKNAAEKAIAKLRREAENAQSPTQLKPKKEKKDVSFSEYIETAQNELVSAVVQVWTYRQSSEKRIKAFIRAVSGLCLCSEKRFQSEVDEYNVKTLNKSIYSDCKTRATMRERFRDANIVFRRLILSGVHKGANPCDSLKVPKIAKERKTAQLGYPQAVRVMRAIQEREGLVNANEYLLFFILCFETGQRPNDVYMFDSRRIVDGHYQFYSHKTEREQRVSHILSKKVLFLISEIQRSRGKPFYKQKFINRYSGNEFFECFWSRSFPYMTDTLRTIIHESIGDGFYLYAAKHFFISEVFRITNSEFWAEAFTHEGRTANTIHYLHPDQDKADEIMIEYQRRFDEEIKKAGNHGVDPGFGFIRSL